MISSINNISINWLFRPKQDPNFADKCLLYSSIALTLLALITAGGAITLLAMSGGSKTINLFMPGCVLSGVCFLSTTLVIACVIAAKCNSASLNGRMHDNSNNEAHDNSKISNHHNEAFTPGDIPNEVYAMMLQHMSEEQCLAIARVNTISKILVDRTNGKRQHKIEPTTIRESICNLPLDLRVGLEEAFRNLVFGLIDRMNSWSLQERLQKKKYVLFMYDRKANVHDLWIQLINYVEDYKLVPLFKTAWESYAIPFLKTDLDSDDAIPRSKDICYIVHLPDKRNQDRYPNKVHLKKIINPQYRETIIKMLLRVDSITYVMHEIYISTSKRIECEASDQPSSNVRMFLDQVEELELISLFFQTLEALDCFPDTFDCIDTDLDFPFNFMGKQHYPLEIFCIDNPDFKG